MPGIAQDTVETFRHRVESFSARYVKDWNNWLAADSRARPELLGSTLRGWQACRPNRMRRHASGASHSGPYLEDLLADSWPHITALAAFDIAAPAPLEGAGVNAALDHLWTVFEQLSYHGKVRGGLAGSVGISKGPAGERWPGRTRFR